MRLVTAPVTAVTRADCNWTPFFPGPLVTRTREGRKQILSSNVDMASLQRAIATGDITRAIAALRLDPAAFRDLEVELSMDPLLPRASGDSDAGGPKANP